MAEMPLSPATRLAVAGPCPSWVRPGRSARPVCSDQQISPNVL